MPSVARLSVVLPAYNEEDNIAPMVERALEVLPAMTEEYEVILVDDGSSDRTAEVGTDLVHEHHPRVRLLRHTRNLGYGAAIRTGFEHASHDLVFYSDSDRQFDLGELEYFLPLAADHDVVIGFRVYRYDSVLRSMVSWTYNRIVRVLFRVRVRDVDCAFKLFRREVLDKITIECEDFFVDTELVAKARKWNFRIVEKGVRHYPRVAGETTVQASDVPRTLQGDRADDAEHLPARREWPGGRRNARSLQRGRGSAADRPVAVEQRYYAEYRAVEDRHWWFLGRRAILLGLLDRHVPVGDPAKRVLDVGCGTGAMLSTSTATARSRRGRRRGRRPLLPGAGDRKRAPARERQPAVRLRDVRPGDRARRDRAHRR